jgi:plasmid stabilization system protein ParE
VIGTPLPIEITASAARHIRDAEEWWRANRTLAPSAVRRELERALLLIAAQPRIGSRASNVMLQGVRRIYLPTIAHHLYYIVLAQPDRIQIVALWHASRNERPPT